MVKIYRGIRKMKKSNFKIIELRQKKTASSIERSVLIKDFIIQEIIGFHNYEKTRKQTIKFNVVINVHQNTIPNERDEKSIVNYEKISKIYREKRK